MKKRIFTVVTLWFCLFLLAGNVNAAGGWTKVKDSSGIKLYERPVSGTDLIEYMAVTTMDIKMEVIGEVLRDVSQYTKWLSDCESAKVEKKYDRNTFVIHLVQNPLLIEDRDIVLKNNSSYDYENGKAVVTFTRTDEVKIPVEKNRVRITTMNGMFQMEYLGRNKTKFIYKLKVDPGGSIPKKVAYSVMKYYPFNTLKKLRDVAKDKKYADVAKGTDEETQINIRSTNEVPVRKIFGDTMMKVVKNKTVMAEILAAETEGIKNIAASGSAYDTIKKTATDIFTKYIDKTIADKTITDRLRNNEKLHAEITEVVQMYSEADDSSVDSIVARYK